MEHQLEFSGSETIRTKHNFENVALDHGVLIDSYKAGNRVFKSNAFVSRIQEHNQKLSYCEVNTHNKMGCLREQL